MAYYIYMSITSLFEKRLFDVFLSKGNFLLSFLLRNLVYQICLFVFAAPINDAMRFDVSLRNDPS